MIAHLKTACGCESYRDTQYPPKHTLRIPINLGHTKNLILGGQMWGYREFILVAVDYKGAVAHYEEASRS